MEFYIFSRQSFFPLHRRKSTWLIKISWQRFNQRICSVSSLVAFVNCFSSNSVLSKSILPDESDPLCNSSWMPLPISHAWWFTQCPSIQIQSDKAHTWIISIASRNTLWKTFTRTISPYVSRLRKQRSTNVCFVFFQIKFCLLFSCVQF